MLRFAPSPTGDMHIGDLRVAILNYLVSRQSNDSFIIRIADSDTKHNIEGKDTEIMQILEKFALIHESVFHQSEHLHMHQTLAIKLLEEDKAFVCTCTQEVTNSHTENTPYSGHCYNVDKSEHAKLKDSGTPFVIRIKKPNINKLHNDIDSFILLNEEGTPTPIFATACDDMLSGITMVICEDTHLSDTAKLIHIKEQLGFDATIKYVHIPAIVTPSDASTVKWLFQEGYIPDAIINYILLLGYTDAPQEIFTLPEAIEWFKLENISKSPVTFDIEKLRFINREHLRHMDDKLLSSFFGFADAEVGKLLKLYLNEASTINELALKIRPIFAPKVLQKPWETQMKTIQKVVLNAPMIHEFDAFKSYVKEKSALEGEDFDTALRLLLTGCTQGPKLSDIYPLIKSYLLEVAS